MICISKRNNGFAISMRWPELPVHLSVQANAVNYATVRFWHQFGLERVILSRELSLEEIGELVPKNIDEQVARR